MVEEFAVQRMCMRKHTGSQMYKNVPCLLRLLDIDDIEKVASLHSKIVATTSRELFIPTTDEDLKTILSGGGIGIGVEHEDELVCMRLLLFESHVELSQESMCILPWMREKTCFMEHCIVDKDFRGNNLQFLTYYLMENMVWDRFDSIYTTVSPMNIFSLRNVIQCGFYAFEMKECYGGHMRFLLRKGLTNQLTIDASSRSRARITDYDRNRMHLSEGKVGYKINHNTAGSWMLYAPVLE